MWFHPREDTHSIYWLSLPALECDDDKNSNPNLFKPVWFGMPHFFNSSLAFSLNPWFVINSSPSNLLPKSISCQTQTDWFTVGKKNHHFYNWNRIGVFLLLFDTTCWTVATSGKAVHTKNWWKITLKITRIVYENIRRSMLCVFQIPHLNSY